MAAKNRRQRYGLTVEPRTPAVTDGDPGTQAGYTPAQFRGYEAQTGAVDDLYDAAKELKLVELKKAFEENSADIDAQRRGIPAVYRARRNSAAAKSALEGRNFNEYAAATGLNSGAGGQAALARSNALRGELGAIDADEDAARRDVDEAGLKLRIQYENDLAAAVANGEYERAAALLDEYRRAEESRVDTDRAQADENYRAYTAQEDRLQRLADEDYRRREADFDRERWEAELKSDRDSAAYSQALKRAETLAKYGDFSGYSVLGYDDATINGMRRAWAASNPLLAYNVGVISASEYYAMTGKYPTGSTGGYRSSGSSGSSGSSSKSSSGGKLSKYEEEFLSRRRPQPKIKDQDLAGLLSSLGG